MTDTDRQSTTRVVLRTLVSVMLCAVLIAGAVVAVQWINRTQPTAQSGGATKKTAALVETISVTRGTYRPKIVVLGRVEPAEDVVLSPRVDGQIVEIDPGFVPGGIVRAGDPLVQLDPADYENMLAMKRSDLRQVEADLAIEMGRRKVAEQEFELLGEEIDPADRDLVLREPQIQAIRARVAVAETAVRQAELDLQRTQVRAPFDAQILRRSVNVGSQVAPRDELARLVGIEEYWVVATVPQRALPRLAFADESDHASTVQLRDPGIWPPGAQRTGRIARMIGTVDDETRLARVLITVTDPLARNADAPRLILGTLLEAEIEAEPIEDIVRLDRRYLRDDNTVWVMREGKLNIRAAAIAFLDSQYAYIREGLEAGDAVVTTGLSTIAEGVPLRRAEPEPPNEGTKQVIGPPVKGGS